MIQYRIRFNNGRVLGPFNKQQLFELKSSNKLIGTEEAQVYPVGEWKQLNTFDFYNELMDPDKTLVTIQKEDETFVLNLTKLKNQVKENEIDKIDITSHKPIELTETIRIASTVQPQEIVEKEFELDLSEEIHLEKDHSKELTSSGDKTLINPVAQQEIERLKRKLKEEEERKKFEEAEKLAQEELQFKKAEEVRRIEADDSTQLIKVNNHGQELIATAVEEEENFLRIAMEIQKKKNLEVNQEEGPEPKDSGKMNNKKKIVITVALAILVFLILSPDDEESKKNLFIHQPTIIEFPIPFDKADIKRSTVEFENGIKLFQTGRYVEIIKSGMHFKNSYENNLANDEALSFLVRSYSEQLKFSSNRFKDAQTIFNLIQGKRPVLVKSPNGVIGINQFYMAIGKHDAANDVVAKYLKLNPKNVTQDLFAVYLKSLMKTGKIDLAKQFYKALIKQNTHNKYSYDAIIEYLLLNQDSDLAKKYLDSAIKTYPLLVKFYLDKADLLAKEKRFEDVANLLRKSEALKLENNDYYRSIFLRISGMLFASKGNVKAATILFNKSLKITDSQELRIALAELKVSDDPKSETEKLISESRAYKHLLQAKDFFDKKSYELALSAAARATDSLPGHIPSELFLAKVQLKLGLANQAIKTLEALLKKYPDDHKINFALIDGYIETYKFNNAKNRIAIISGSAMKQTPEFASLNAKIYIKMGDSLQAISWLRNSINMNPLNDYDNYQMAEILIKKSNFDAARTLLYKCMELDPVNPDYRIAYSRIVYEQQDDQAAVGYLLDLLDEFGENPKILGEIAIFYYRAGKVKDFLAFKERIEKLPNKDKALYDFLIKAALIDERYDEIPILVEKLLKFEPGDLESMMIAGKVLFENGKLIDAAKWFKRVKDKMDSYPKVQFYQAKIKFLEKDWDGALQEVKADMDANGENDVDLSLMGQIYEAKGELIEAENSYKKAQKINSKSYDALVGMAGISTKRNNFDMALDLYKKAMRQKGDESVLHKKIGDVYRLLGQGALAVESYKMYLEMEPEASDKSQIESYINLMQ